MEAQVDAQETLVRKSSHCSAVFFRANDIRFALVEIGTDTCVVESRALRAQGYQFVLVIGLVDGRLAAAKYEAATEGDALSWLESLFKLEDNREDRR